MGGQGRKIEKIGDGASIAILEAPLVAFLSEGNQREQGSAAIIPDADAFRSPKPGFLVGDALGLGGGKSDEEHLLAIGGGLAPEGSAESPIAARGVESAIANVGGDFLPQDHPRASDVGAFATERCALGLVEVVGEQCGLRREGLLEAGNGSLQGFDGALSGPMGGLAVDEDGGRAFSKANIDFALGHVDFTGAARAGDNAVASAQVADGSSGDDSFEIRSGRFDVDPSPAGDQFESSFGIKEDDLCRAFEKEFGGRVDAGGNHAAFHGEPLIGMQGELGGRLAVDREASVRGSGEVHIGRRDLRQHHGAEEQQQDDGGGGQGKCPGVALGAFFGPAAVSGGFGGTEAFDQKLVGAGQVVVKLPGLWTGQQGGLQVGEVFPVDRAVQQFVDQDFEFFVAHEGVPSWRSMQVLSEARS